MGLYVSQWLFGEDIFLKLCNDYWEPHLTLQLVGQDKGVLGFSFLNKEGESLLYSIVPQHSYEEFFTRYRYALAYVVKKLEITEFVQDLVKVNIPDGQISKEVFASMNEEFFYEIMNYDFLNSVPLFQRMSSLIFFDSWELIEHFKFIYYPKGGNYNE